MIKIAELNIYVGTKREIREARLNGMTIVNAIRNAKGYECHQSVVGWKGRGCPKDSPYYYYKEEENDLYLNLMDTEDKMYISDVIVDKTLEFIDLKLQQNKKVFICCSQGISRSPSIALIYMLEKGLISSEYCIEDFREKYYEKYEPKRGFVDYINERYG